MDGAVTCKLALDRMKTDETTAQDNSSRLFRADSAVLLLFGQPRGANGNCLFLSMALQVQPEDLKDIPSRPGRPGPMGTNLQRLPDSFLLGHCGGSSSQHGVCCVGMDEILTVRAMRRSCLVATLQSDGRRDSPSSWIQGGQTNYCMPFCRTWGLLSVPCFCGKWWGAAWSWSLTFQGGFNVINAMFFAHEGDSGWGWVHSWGWERRLCCVTYILADSQFLATHDFSHRQ